MYYTLDHTIDTSYNNETKYFADEFEMSAPSWNKEPEVNFTGTTYASINNVGLTTKGKVFFIASLEYNPYYANT